MSIIQESDKYVTDEITVSGRKMSIKINEQGYYRIDVEGSGDKPELCEHLFTSLSEARKAVNGYVNENAAAVNKKRMLMEIAEREYPRKKSAKSSTE
jgi:hypothetical protein